MWKRYLLLQQVFLLQGTIDLVSAVRSFEEALQSLDPDITTSIAFTEDVNGTFPTEIGEFSRLTSLELFSNDLNGATIPSQIGKLQRLESMDFPSNGLNGKIPAQIGNLTQLTILRLSDNDLNGEIPSQIGKLTQLSWISLNGNNFNGEFLDIFKLKQLSFIDLSGNDLRIPVAEIPMMSNLRTLVLSDNAVYGKIPSQIGKLQTLEFLYLSGNNLTGTLPSELSQLSNLNSVRLAKNKFEINCEVPFLEWYIHFSEKVEDRYDSSLQCYSQLYPFHLDLSSFASGPQETIENSKFGVYPGSRSVTFNWTHPNVSKLENFTVEAIRDAGYSYESFPAVDFKECKIFKGSYNNGMSIGVFDLVGFEITVFGKDENGGTFVYSRHCINAADLEINNIIFQYSLDLLSPATEYEVIVRPFNIDIFYRAETQMIFGPPSLRFPFKTEDDIPEVAPVNLRLLSAREDQIDLTWDDTLALQSNGEIIEYEVHSIKDNKNYTTAIRQISITGLEPNTEYSYKVRARTTVGGFSNNYSSTVTTQTCPLDMKRSDSTTCFAIKGSFAVSENEALVCAVEVPNIVSDCETQEELTVQTLNIIEGFWRPNINEFREIRRCPVPEFCLKGEARDNSSVRTLADISIEPESVQCSSFHRGVYCSSCVEGYVITNSDGCTECTDDIKSNHEANYIYFVLVVVVLILCCQVYVVLTSVGGPPSERWSIVLKYYRKIEQNFTYLWGFLGVKLRIFGGFLQVIFAFQSVLYMDANTNFLVEIMGSVANLNLGSSAYAMEVYCAIDINHYLRLLLYTLPPLCLALLLLLSYLALTKIQKDWKKSLIASCFEVFLFVSFLIYPAVSRVIFDTFFCEEFETVEEDSDFIFQSALRSDYRLSCSFASSERIGWVVYAICMVLVYPVGILMIYLYLLFKETNRELIKDLVYHYKTNRHWFEAYELVRKLLQTSFVSFCVQFGNLFASSVALNLSMVFLLALVYLNPYKNYSDFGFAIVSLSVLVFASQLNSWFDVEECIGKCQAEKKGDAIAALVLFETIALFLFTGIGYNYATNFNTNSEDIFNVADEENTLHTKIETINSQVMGQKLDGLYEKIQGLKEKKQALIEKNNEQSNEIGLLKFQVESLKSELSRYKTSDL